MKHYDSVYSLNKIVSHLIDDREIDRALKLIRNFVERIVTEPLCTSRLFGSKTLDDLCQRIGNVTLSKMTQQKLGRLKESRSEPIFVYVVTKLQRSGGHTRVIENLIDAYRGGSHVILSTELDGRSDLDYIKSGVSRRADVILELAPKVNYSGRLSWLQQRLIDLSPAKAYLFNHHQDSIATAAIQPEMNLDASFYHHGDHHLCLGVYLAHLQHIDPHPMGFHNCRDILGIVNNIYVPLTVEDKGSRPADMQFLSGGSLTTCTVARSNKIEVPYFISYLDLIPGLLKTTSGKHIHVGRLSPWALFRIRRGIRQRGIRSDRFVYIPWVPSVWKTLHDYRVDLYICSFPYGGGLTLIEAMGSGTPVVLHRHIFSRMLSGLELAYPEAFAWRYPEELIAYCVSLNADVLANASNLARLRYEKFHTASVLSSFVSGHGSPTPSEFYDQFSIRYDEAAVLSERNARITAVLWKAIYRSLRKLSVILRP